MSREQYQVPTAGSQSFGMSVGRDFGSATEGPAMQYICSDCAVKMSLRKNDPIRCKECGGRVLYKERTKRMVQFEAR
ncbi:metallothionein-I gene transcription activator [Phialemonium atrogriseum]|uniref:Metallothionein-I gene transcription activator n=1 Tax=Phialemonium atrogriseum TaxID=1093897 RepID=A0AAJ0FQU3_9PEZI|nr:metallothionein-I gene transcription activator [Phialemonium atrogriseum]KAK1771613.1 metallothionein-I gene transcription activator [Phialemonium atrogriseum]